MKTEPRPAGARVFLPVSKARRHLQAAILALSLMLLPSWQTPGQQEYRGVCANVKILILQELTLERIGFEATLELTNNDGEDPITDFYADLTFENPLLSTVEAADDASQLFFVRAPELEGISDVNGSGVIGPTKKAVIRWFIIPKILAGGQGPEGVRYRVGAQLSGKFVGAELPPEILRVFPDTITVKPEPQLEITYFQPRDVQGDDPFSPQVESPIPFTLGVLVKNSGYGLAKSVKINSQQPKIVEQKNGLLLVAQLLGARVMDSALQRASLTVDLGDIPPLQTRKGAWDMITSLSGEFIEFKATYTHATELGGLETSVIKSLEAHFIAHEVLNDQPGRDTIQDFLADTDRDLDQIPDTLYESQGNLLPVNHLTSAVVEGSGLDYEIRVAADREGWGYVRLPDPGQARLKIERVTRSDGKEINLRNVWTHVRYDKGTNAKLTHLNLLDLVEPGREYLYALRYSPGETDAEAPITTLNFAGSVIESGGKYYVTPETQMYFVSEDESPVSIVYSLDGGEFIPALPFWVRELGEHQLEYRASDSHGNEENLKSAILVLADEEPDIGPIQWVSSELFVSGDALSVRPRQVELEFSGGPSPLGLAADVEIYSGAKAWVQLRGVPASPTPEREATVIVGGLHVDYYMFRLDGGAWSSELPAAEPILLAGLDDGGHEVEVMGRSVHSAFDTGDQALRAGWEVSGSAPATVVTEAPWMPSLSRDVRIGVGGAGVTHYRWTIDGGYFRAEQPASTPLVLDRVEPGSHMVSIIGKIDGVWQSTNAAAVLMLQIAPRYGSELSLEDRVRLIGIPDAGGSVNRVVWDGRDDQGRELAPGWYTVLLRLRDQAGRESFSSQLVRIGEMSGSHVELVGAERGPKNPHGRGRWAVWQDQSEGNWKIYGMDLSRGDSQVVSLSSGNLSQENPQTDGQFVVWQARQPNGSWDLMIKNMDAGEAQQVTATYALDETKPAVEWPWLVYQSRMTGNTNAPWQLQLHDLRTRTSNAVWPGSQDQIDPAIEGGRVVWQDHRDVGFGEIYFKDIESGELKRLTADPYGQYHPAIHGHWVVWQDNRHGQVEIYGYDLWRGREVRVTDTAENEARPSLEGEWLVCEEDSLGVASANLRLLHLTSGRAVPLTRTLTLKARPSIAWNRVLWEDRDPNGSRIRTASLPAVQAVFENRNAVAVTQGIVEAAGDGFGLLRLWNQQAGVVEITRYEALLPDVIEQRARMAGGQPEGDNFPLFAGEFVWVKFDGAHVLELGHADRGPINLAAGVNVFSYSGFPGNFSAYQLVRDLGFDQVKSVRMLDSQAGKWMVASVLDNQLVGSDFPIPRLAVLMLDLTEARTGWQPH